MFASVLGSWLSGPAETVNLPRWSLRRFCRVASTLIWAFLFLSQKNRYEIYIGLLKEGVKELLSGGENDAPGLKKSHSSPSLNQESPVSAKVKRNVSERKDYRPETPSIKQKVT